MKEIERASWNALLSYFRDHGEAASRRRKRRVVERLQWNPNYVMATAAGPSFHPENA